MNGYETEQLRKAHIVALTRELNTYEGQAVHASGQERERLESLAEEVRKSLRAFGDGAQKPQERATRRGPKSVEKESR